MNSKHDIETIEDIKILVNTFYNKVRNDAFLAPVFNAKIADRWPQHLEKMYTFWQTVLLGEHTYFGSPFPPHVNLPVDHSHFEQWLHLFTQTISELFYGEKAAEAVWRAQKMAQMFQMKLAHIKNQGFQTIV